MPLGVNKMQNDIVMIIMSCDAFSDLWDGHIKLLGQNWNNRGMKTVIVTDKKTDKSYDGVDVFFPENCADWSDRLKAAATFYDANYYFVTLDDYYIINRINNTRIQELFRIVKEEKVDYMRLFKHPVRATGEKFASRDDLHFIKTEEMYSVNLYSGIWKKEFLFSCFGKPLNAWEFEVSLSKKARDYNAKCVVDIAEDFEILDVVRKGKLIRKAGRYIKKHGLYTGDRKTNSLWFESKLGIKVFARRHLPSHIRPWARKIAVKFGMRSYSNGSS